MSNQVYADQQNRYIETELDAIKTKITSAESKYEERTVNVNMTCGDAANTFAVTLTFIIKEDQILLDIPILSRALVTTSAAYFESDVLLDADLRSFGVPLIESRDGLTNYIGYVELTDKLRIYKNQNKQNFDLATDQGWLNISIGYSTQV